MTDKQEGVGAEVGARKLTDDEVVQTEGAVDDSPGLGAWVVFLTMVGFDVLGVWKFLELVLAL